jgi:hypothetical protein
LTRCGKIPLTLLPEKGRSIAGKKNDQDPMSPAIEVLEVLLKARLIALFSGARGASLASAVGVIRPGAEEKHGREGNDHKGTHGNLRYATLPIKTLRPVGFA